MSSSCEEESGVENSHASSDSSDEREELHHRSSADEQQSEDGKENKNRKDSKSNQQRSFIKNKKQHSNTVLTSKIRDAQQPLKKNRKTRARQTRIRTIPAPRQPCESSLDESRTVRRTVHIPPAAKRATVIVKKAGTADRAVDLYYHKRCRILGKNI